MFQPQMPRMERLFKALADSTRLRILALLVGGEVCVCHIHGSLRIPQPKASRHLAYLRRAGVVQARKDGLWVHYRLAEQPDPAIRTVVQLVLHAIGHAETVRLDAERLGKRTGCCPLPPALSGRLPCCGEGAVRSAAVRRRGRARQPSAGTSSSDTSS